MTEFATLIENRRDEIGLMQQEVADKVGVRLRTYQNWERGATRPKKPEYVWDLSKALDMSVKHLVDALNDDFMRAVYAVQKERKTK